MTSFSVMPLTSLNAIKLSAQEVAATFVAPPAFNSLLRADNVILTGPRGSGKTTMLKMLQSEALEAWDDRMAAAVREQVQAVGVFIGADRTWHEQLSLADVPFEDGGVRGALAHAAFSTQVLRALVEAMRSRLHAAPEFGHLRVKLDAIQESQLSARLSRLFLFERQAGSLSTVHALLTDRLIELGRFRNLARRGVIVERPAWTDFAVLVLVDAAVYAFNESVDEPSRKWALLFDELELAPEDVVRELLGALRGAQPRLLFKLSLAPVDQRLDQLTDDAAPVPGQDYEHIPLTYARKLPALRFAKTLVARSFSQQRTDPPPSVERLLGAGTLDSREDSASSGASTTPYAVGSPLWRKYAALADRDESFRRYLDDRGINLQTLEDLKPAKRAADLRKIRNLVVVREFFRDAHGKRRSRKSHALYTGADSILSLPDGNPRMIISLVRHLFPLIEGAGTSARVRPPAQQIAIAATLQRFIALLEAQQAERINDAAVGVLDLLDAIGRALAKRVVEDDFNDDVRLTLKVTSTLRPETHRLLLRSINAGALVHVPPRNSDGRIPTDLDGQQFRLSHLLSCHYGLPIHLTEPAPLHSLLPFNWLLSPRVEGRAQPRLLHEQGGLFESTLEEGP